MQESLDVYKRQVLSDVDDLIAKAQEFYPGLPLTLYGHSMGGNIGLDYKMCIRDRVKPVRWHLIGHLQTNKVKYIIDKVSMIHSVDSLHLAKEINKRAAQHDLTMDILIQVNSAEEESKFGITTEETDRLISDIAQQCPNIRIRGLMCIAPFEEDPEDARKFFAEVKEIYDRYAEKKTERCV